ncbi:MAG: PAS domain-containing protein [Dermabacter sp.]|nr:PAS domain-containing protein [Dermabacter sp.]
MHTQPTGEVITFGAHELFFSTTDEQGRIAEANEVFVRLSRYERGALTHQPHNIVRHPDMPSGVYRLLWDALHDGRAFGGYIRNLAADGARYDVFATVTPLPGGGYLSVRSRVMDEGQFQQVWAAYTDAARQEIGARSGGTSAREAAGIGAAALEETVRALGFENYAAFQRRALVNEVTAREEALSGSLGMVITNTIDLIVRAALGLHAEVSVLSFEQEALEDLAQRVDATAGRVREDIDLHAAGALGLWDEADGALRADIAALHGQLTALGALSRETQFRIALARLHAAMVTQFADERFEIVDPEQREEAHRAIKVLVSALVDGIDTMVEHVAALHAAIASIRGLIDTVSADMRARRALIDQYLDDRYFSPGSEGRTALGEHAELMEPAFSRAVVGADTALATLAALNTALLAFDDGYDAAPLLAMRESLVESIAQTAV